MKAPNVTGARFTSRRLSSLPGVKSLFVLGAAFALMGRPELRAGVQYWDPDGDPANNNTNGVGTGLLGSNVPPYSQANPAIWETPFWTDDSNMPASITGPLGDFKEGDDVIFWGIAGAGANNGSAPYMPIFVTASHMVNSLSFYSQISSGTSYDYWLGWSDDTPLTNATGIINCDAGPASHAASGTVLYAQIGGTLVTTNGLQTYGSGTVQFTTHMKGISGGPIIISGCTRPGSPGGVKLPTLGNWNVALHGPYQPFPLDSQIIITNGAQLTLWGQPLITHKPLVIWDGMILSQSGPNTVQAPQYVVRTCRYGANAFTAQLNDDGSGNAALLKIGNTYFSFGAVTNYFLGGTTISQGAIVWGRCDPKGSCFGPGDITMGDTNTGSSDLGLMLNNAAPSTLNTNLVNNIVVTTNGTGRVFIGNQSCAGIVRLSGNISLGRTAYLGGSGSKPNDPTYYTIAQRGTICDGVISGPGGVMVAGASGLFYSSTDAFPSAQGWNSGGTVELTNPNNSYSGGSTVNWGTLEAAANGSLGTGNVTVNSPGILLLDTAQGIAPNANLTLSGASPLVNLNFSGTCTINALSTNGGLTYATSGTFGSSTSGAATTNSVFTNNGVLKVVTTQTGSTITLASSLNPVNLNTNYGTAVQFTATVASVAAGTPTGTVTFKNGSTILGSSLLSGGIAALTTQNLPAGTNAITAWYSGDANFVPSGTLPLLQIVCTTQSTNNTAVGISANGLDSFTLAFQGTPGVYYSVVSSPDLAAPMANWTVVPGSTTLVPAAGTWSVVISKTSPAQYYRAKVAGIAP